MNSKSGSIPRYRRQKRPRSPDQAFVEFGGARHCLGRYDTTESHEAYHRLVAEWMANGRRLPRSADDITITEVAAAYWRHAQTYYRKPDGTTTSTVHKVKSVLCLLRELYGPTAAVDFGPRALRSVRQRRMIERRWCRRTVNEKVYRVKQIFKWAAAQELVTPEVYHGLQVVCGLRRGRTEAKGTHGREACPPGPRGRRALAWKDPSTCHEKSKTSTRSSPTPSTDIF